VTSQEADTNATRKISGSGSGGVVPGYSILARVGRGGMGAVFKAIQLSMNRLVALKILPMTLAKDKTYIRRFLREAKSAAQMNHANLTKVYDVGSYRGVFYFSMEFVEGATLLELIKSESRLDPETATDIVLQASRGLNHAHSHFIVHRDIKPENIIIAGDGTVKITDMGLAKRTDTPDHDITVTGQVIGTPCYMSPEQITDPKSLDSRSDIYSLGATFYHMLTGRRPFQGENSAQTMLKVVGEEPNWSLLDAPVQIVRVIKRMMAKDPARRFQTSSELTNDLLYLKEKVFSPHRSRRLAFISSITSPLQSSISSVQSVITEAPSRKWTLGLAAAALLAVILAIVVRPEEEAHSAAINRQEEKTVIVRVEPGLTYEQYLKKGQDLGMEKRWEEALEYFSHATAADPYSSHAWNNRGVCLHHLGEYEKAIESYKKAIGLNSDVEDSHFNLGKALLKLNRFEPALAEFDHALKIDKDSYGAWWGKAAALTRLGRSSEAREARRRVAELKPLPTSP